jgi:phospholipid/cholesterol/gamma-HCH transport system substrate-binding protein
MRLDHAVVRMDTLLTRVDRGEGSIGKMMNDPVLYEEMRGTLRDVRVFVNDIRENPKKYVKLSLF